MEAPPALSVRPHELLMKAGDVIYLQNTVSDGVYIIIEGRVQISHESDDKIHNIAVLDAGSLLGEVGAIEQTPRSVTAKTLTSCKLLFVDANTFRRIFKDGDPLIRYIIETLANRLRATYSASEDANSGHSEAFYTTQFASRENIMIGADSPIVETVLPVPIEIMSLPFKVGNVHSKEPMAIVTNTELKLPLFKHRSLSDHHFEIVSRQGELWVRDLGSKHGTIVNSRIISRFGEEGVAHLHLGLNRIVAGSSDSSIRFLIQVPWTEEKVG